MEFSILIAKIFCVGYLSLGLGILFNGDYYKKEWAKIMDNSSFLLFAGLMAIVFGFIIIEFHNTWNSDWTTIITIIGWIALVKGILLLALPKFTSIFKNTVLHSDNFSKILIPALFILGIIFGYLGFIHQ